jgi:hypothetical protein
MTAEATVIADRETHPDTRESNNESFIFQSASKIASKRWWSARPPNSDAVRSALIKRRGRKSPRMAAE